LTRRCKQKKKGVRMAFDLLKRLNNTIERRVQKNRTQSIACQEKGKRRESAWGIRGHTKTAAQKVLLM